MVNFNFNSAAMPEFDPLTPHDHRIGDFDGFTGDILEWAPLVDSCLFDCPIGPRVDDVPDLPDFDAVDTALPPPKRARVEEGLKSFTVKDFGENFNSTTPEPPDPLKAVDFTDDDINRWVDSCLNFSPTEQPCVEANGSIANAIEISSMQPSTSSSQLVDDVDLSGKSPQSPMAMLDNNGRGKKTKRTRWTPEEHRLFLMGMKMYGKGKWKIIAEEVVKTKTHIQIASHAQKYNARCDSNGTETGSSSSTPANKKKRKSIHDVTIKHIPDLD